MAIQFADRRGTHPFVKQLDGLHVRDSVLSRHPGLGLAASDLVNKCFELITIPVAHVDGQIIGLVAQKSCETSKNSRRPPHLALLSLPFRLVHLHILIRRLVEMPTLDLDRMIHTRQQEVRQIQTPVFTIHADVAERKARDEP